LAVNRQRLGPDMPTPPGAARRLPSALRRQPTALLALAAAVCAGCSTPFKTTETEDLQNSLVNSVIRELEEAREFDQMLTTARAATVDSLQLRPEHIPQLESMAGPRAHDPTALDFGADLHGQPQRSARVSLQDVIRTGVERNLAVRFARLQPAIREADVVAAEAAFDWSLFSNVDSSYVHQPQVGGGFSGPGEDERYRHSGSLGLRKALPTGGQFALQQEW